MYFFLHIFSFTVIHIIPLGSNFLFYHFCITYYWYRLFLLIIMFMTIATLSLLKKSDGEFLYLFQNSKKWQQNLNPPFSSSVTISTLTFLFLLPSNKTYHECLVWLVWSWSSHILTHKLSTCCVGVFFSIYTLQYISRLLFCFMFYMLFILSAYAPFKAYC